MAAVLLLQLLKKWNKQFQAAFDEHLLLLAAIVFLLGPMATEIVIWKVCSHYLISTIFILMIINWTMDYLKNPKGILLIGIYLTYYIATFFLEIFYLTPFFILVMVLAFYFKGHIDKSSFINILLRVFLPMILIFGLYFITLKLVIGQGVARISASGNPEESLLNIRNITQRLLLFNGRVVLMDYIFPQEWRNHWYRLCQSNGMIYSIWVLILIAIATFIRFFKRINFQWQLILLFFVLFQMSLCIALPMGFIKSYLYEGNRYYYLATLFYYPFILLMISVLIKNRVLRNFILFLYSIGTISLTGYINRQVQKSAQVFWGLLDHYNFEDKPKVLLLNIPNYYNGVSIIGSYEFGNFQRHLKLLQGKERKGKIYDVAGYNMSTPWDGAQVQVINDKEIAVTLNQFGTWWWSAYLGAVDYENDVYKFTWDTQTITYKLQFHQAVDSNTLILYSVGNEWKIVDMQQQKEVQR